MKTDQLRHTLDTIEENLRVLEDLGENINAQYTVFEVLTKFPKKILLDLENAKDPEAPWEVKHLRGALEVMISRRERVDMRCSHLNLVEPEVRAKSPVVETRTVVPKCLFCGDNHWMDQCSQHTSLASRRLRVLKIGLCTICLRSNHKTRDCGKDYVCFHCKSKNSHHRSLCPSLFVSASIGVAEGEHNSTQVTAARASKDEPTAKAS